MNGAESIVKLEGWVVKSPPLERTGPLFFRARWRRRWFTLQEGRSGSHVLNYYSDESKRRLKGTIPLDECEQVDIGLTAEDGKHKYEFMFAIKTPKRMYFLAVDTLQEMTTWVQMVCEACGLRSKDDESPAYSRTNEAVSMHPKTMGRDPTNSSQSASAEGRSACEQNLRSISSPYIHISTCYSGKPSSGEVASLPSNSLVMVGDDPDASAVDEVAMVSNLSLQQQQSSGVVALPPGRPPKPAHLVATVANQRPPSLRPEIYANSAEMQDVLLQEKNNNQSTDSNSQLLLNQQPLAPQVSRNLKPGRRSHQVFSNRSRTLGSAPGGGQKMGNFFVAGHSATLGPPVKRNLKPRIQGFGEIAESRKLFSSVGTGLSSTGDWVHRHAGLSSDEGSNSESGSRRNSGSEEQIYFYMSSVGTANGSRGQPLMIPAGSFDHPSLSYIDLDLPKVGGDDSAIYGVAHAKSTATEQQQPPLKIVGDQSATIYKTVDFVKTNAFNRTKREVESERYRNYPACQGQADMNNSLLLN